jgi:signal transduction histidine kinase/DNA-binding NarL/FixJ family response regulator
MVFSQNQSEGYNQIRIILSQATQSHNNNDDSLHFLLKKLGKGKNNVEKGFISEVQAIHFMQNKKIEACIQAYKNAEVYYEGVPENERLKELYPILVFMLTNYNRMGEAMDYSVKWLDFAEKNKYEEEQILALTELGRIKYAMKQMAEGKDILLKAITLHQKYYSRRTDAYIYLGEVYRYLNKPDSALFYLDKGLVWVKEHSTMEDSINVVIEKAKCLAHVKRYKEAEQIFNSLTIQWENSGQKSKLSSINYLKAKMYNEQGRYAEALENTNKALLILGTRKNFRVRSNILYQKIIALNALNRTNESAKEYMNWKAAIDSLNEMERRATYADAASRHNTFQLQEDINTKASEIKDSRYKNNLYLGLLLISIAIGFTLWQYMKAKNQKTKHEAQLIKIESDRIKELDKVKTAFFTNISHEFRTPLTLIIEPLRTLDREFTEGTNRNTFKRMRYAADSMLKLINDMLDLAKIESGLRTLKLEAGDLTFFIQRLLYSIQSLADLKHIKIDYQKPSFPLYAKYDKACIESIVVNLLTNAVKYTPDFGLITIQLNTEADKILFRIKDSGIGIEEEDQKYIFDRFFRVTHDNKTLGSGIGLSLIKELVELHGGTIQVSSKIDEGTSFSFYIPYIEAESKSLATMEEFTYNLQEPSSQKLLHAHKILIVEDNLDLSNHMKNLLQETEIILQAENGIIGYDLATAELPDIIITDLIMPQMDGMELISKLRKDERTNHIPIILLTGNTDIENKIEGWKRGSDAYMNKPVNNEELLAITANLIHQRTILQEKFKNITSDPSSSYKATTPEEVFIQKLHVLIEENYEDENFSIEQLSGLINMSRSNLFRKVTSITGLNPTLWIRNFRLNKAMQLLKQGNLPKEVCYLVGFNSFSYFSKCFKDKFGIVPSGV